MTEEIVKRQDTAVAIPSAQPANIIAKPVDGGLALEISKLVPGAGQIELTEKQIGILYAPIDEDAVEIRPDGLVYLPWMEYVTRLRQAFGLNWAIIPKDEPRLGPSKSSILWGFYLVIHGKLAGYAIGEQAYSSSNATMNWSDAVEGAKSNALMRLCKGIGISLDLWKPSFIRNWKAKYAEEYVDSGKKKWRKKDSNRQEPEIAGRGVQAPPTFSSSKQENATPGPKNGTSAGGPGFFADNEPIKEAEVVEPGPGDPLSEDEFFGGDKPVVYAGKDDGPSLFSPDALDGLVNAIKEALKAEKIDEKLFKAFLYETGPRKNPPKKYVGLRFGHPSFREGDPDDLKKLYSEIRGAIKTFLKWKATAK
jgi:hypothetical protein